METEVKSSESSPTSKKRLLPGILWGMLVFVIAAVVAANIKTYMHRPSETSVPESPLSRLAVHHQVPDFALTNQHGNALARADLEGKVWVADFIFTTCPTICPPMTDEMVRLQNEFASESELHFVSFSVDPERDTPAVLSRYADDFGVDGSRWAFLTGEKTSIYQLAHEGFNLATGHRGSEILHSTRFVLVDRQGKVRGYYDSRSKANLQRLRRDIKTLLG